MTGLECLQQELIKRGLNAAQAQSKVVPAVLDIVSQSTMYTDIAALQKDIKELAKTRAALEKEVADYRAHIKRSERELEELATEKDRMARYIETFNKSLSDCSSEEGRDRLRAAQFFANNTRIETCYDNTAFIRGLAAILSGGKIADFAEKIEKLDPDKFKADKRKLRRI